MQTVIKAGSAEHTTNKSRFIAEAQRCESEREVGLFLRQLASQHANAHHLAYAYRVKTPDGIIPRFSDAGEPSGTAGKPILQILDGQNIINIAVGVIRYYGGIHLGTGGLVKAYGGTAKQAIEQAVLGAYVEMQTIEIVTNYKRVDELIRVVKQANGEVLDKQFAQDVRFIVKLPIDLVDNVVNRFNDAY